MHSALNATLNSDELVEYCSLWAKVVATYPAGVLITELRPSQVRHYPRNELADIVDRECVRTHDELRHCTWWRVPVWMKLDAQYEAWATLYYWLIGTEKPR